jgi:prevent-host-death family protein
MPTPTVPTESLKFTEARHKLSSLLDRVFQRELRVRLYKGNTPVAAIVSIGDLERLEQYDRQREEAFREISKLGENLLDVSDEELETRINETVARVRRELWAEGHTATPS